jgi:hypothetical protein
MGLEGWSSSAALADADRDGDLDLYVTRYMEYEPAAPLYCGDPATGVRTYCDPSIYRGAGDRFYYNLGEGRFQEGSAKAGILPAAGRGLGVVFTDLDGDGAADLYIANDLDINLLFRNRGDGTFEDHSLISGAGVNREGRPEAGMGLAVGDVDGDLDPDLAVTNFDVETNTLYRNLGQLSFEDVSSASGFGPPSFNRLAFGVAAVDLDQDGDLDFYLANGHIFERPRRENVAFRQPDQLLLGDGTGRFVELECAWLRHRPTVARGLAVADFDNDGDIDLALQENDGPAALLANGSDSGRWLGLTLAGRAPNRDAIGARSSLGHDPRRQMRWVMAGDSYQSSSDRRSLFAAPEADAGFELFLAWPSRRRQRFSGLATGHYLRVPEPD